MDRIETLSKFDKVFLEAFAAKPRGITEKDLIDHLCTKSMYCQKFRNFSGIVKLSVLDMMSRGLIREIGSGVYCTTSGR